MKWLDVITRVAAPLAMVVGAMALGLAVECRVGGVQVVAVTQVEALADAVRLSASSSSNRRSQAPSVGPDR